MQLLCIGTHYMIGLILCIRVCSFPRCAEAEEDAGERAGETARNEIPTGDECEYPRICEDEPGDYDCDEESSWCSETYPWGSVRLFPDPPWVCLLTYEHLARWKRLTRLWRTSRNRHSLQPRYRIKFRLGPLVLILMRCAVSSRIPAR